MIYIYSYIYIHIHIHTYTCSNIIWTYNTYYHVYTCMYVRVVAKYLTHHVFFALPGASASCSLTVITCSKPDT